MASAKCPRCGTISVYGTPTCPRCGVIFTYPSAPQSPYNQQTNPQNPYAQPQQAPQSGLGIGGFVLSFLVPLVGLVMCCIDISNKNDGHRHSFAPWGIAISAIRVCITLFTGWASGLMAAIMF